MFKFYSKGMFLDKIDTRFKSLEELISFIEKEVQKRYEDINKRE